MSHTKLVNELIEKNSRLQDECAKLKLDRDQWQLAAVAALEALTATRLTLGHLVRECKRALLGAKFWTQDSVMGQLATLVDTVEAKMKEQEANDAARPGRPDSTETR